MVQYDSTMVLMACAETNIIWCTALKVICLGSLQQQWLTVAEFSKTIWSPSMVWSGLSLNAPTLLCPLWTWCWPCMIVRLIPLSMRKNWITTSYIVHPQSLSAPFSCCPWQCPWPHLPHCNPLLWQSLYPPTAWSFFLPSCLPWQIFSNGAMIVNVRFCNGTAKLSPNVDPSFLDIISPQDPPSYASQ